MSPNARYWTLHWLRVAFPVAADDGCALSPRSGGGAVATDALVIGPVTLPCLAGATVFG